MSLWHVFDYICHNVALLNCYCSENISVLLSVEIWLVFLRLFLQALCLRKRKSRNRIFCLPDWIFYDFNVCAKFLKCLSIEVAKVYFMTRFLTKLSFWLHHSLKSKVVSNYTLGFEQYIYSIDFHPNFFLCANFCYN